MRFVVGAVLVAMLAIGLPGCGLGGLSASSTCEDFANASPEEQFEAVSSLSTEFETPEYTTPLGEPEVRYFCAGNPDVTLEEFFTQAHDGGAKAEADTDEPESSSGEADTLAGVSAVDQLLKGIPQEGSVLGEPDAPIEIIEFVDPQSPACASFAEEQLSQLIPTQIAEGAAKISFRNFLIIGPESIPAGAAAVAAGRQGRGWSFIEIFYRNQGIEESGYATDSFLTEVAEAAGVPNIDRWNEERQSTEVMDETEASTDEAAKLGLTGVPSFAIRGPGTKGLKLLPRVADAGDLESAIASAETG